MKHKRDFHKKVRVIYRACRRLYGIEHTQDECIKIFKVVFPELHRLRNIDEERATIPLNVVENILLVTHEWKSHFKLSDLIAEAITQMQMHFDWPREELIQFYEDITPVAIRVRKLTPRETGRLMGLNDKDMDTMFSSGLSNSSLYKLHGNSIVVDVMTALFDKLLVNTTQDKEEGVQLSLF